MYKVNKDLNRNKVKVAFTNDSAGKFQVNNGGEGFLPSEMRQTLRQTPGATVFESAPITPGATITNPNQAIVLGSLNIDDVRVNAMIGVISRIFTVVNLGDLRNNILNFLDILSERAFRVFMEILDSFVRDFGDVIQNQLNRVIPYEQYMYDAFQALYGAARESLNDYLEGLWEQNRHIPIELLQEYFYDMRETEVVNTTCTICNGMFFS